MTAARATGGSRKARCEHIFSAGARCGLGVSGPASHFCGAHQRGHFDEERTRSAVMIAGQEVAEHLLANSQPAGCCESDRRPRCKVLRELLAELLVARTFPATWLLARWERADGDRPPAGVR